MYNDGRTISAHDFRFNCNCLCSGYTTGDEEERLETYNSILDRSHYKEPRGLYLDSEGVKRLLNRMYGRENAMRKGYIDRSPEENYRMYMRSVCTIIPDRIIFNPPATIVFWTDGTKTVVKCAEGEKFDPYTGFCYAFAERCLGSISHIKKLCRICSTGLPEASEAIVKGAKEDAPMTSFEKQSVAYMRHAICDKFADGWSIDQIAKRFKMSDKDIYEALGKEFE